MHAVLEVPAGEGAVAGAYAVGWTAIDELHVECDLRLSGLQSAADDEQIGALDALYAHLLDHFGAEEALMAASDYPKLDCHKREHDAVLRVVARVRPMCEAGQHDVVRRLAVEFPHWFEIHAGTMDMSLAAWLRQQSADEA